MSGAVGEEDALAAVPPRRFGGTAAIIRLNLQRLQAAFAHAIGREVAERRVFLWLPVAAGAGVVLYLRADHEPMLWLPLCLALAAAALAAAVRNRMAVKTICLLTAAVFAGFFSAAWRTARVAAPAIDRLQFAHLTGYIEQMDFRRTGARFIVRVTGAKELAAGAVPFRVRLTTRITPEVEAGAFVEVSARLLPPAQAALPDGYNFARDAFFARIGAVGSLSGRIRLAKAPQPPDPLLAAGMMLDRARNALVRRVSASIGGDAGAIAAAMVTGKRDLLSEDAKTLIREAGIFHIITISGVQMTLVAAILFVGARRLLACSRTLALRYPIKKWAAAAAMLGALAYDIATGSRVGTERALVMTLIVLGSVLVDRRALTMRNLGHAVSVIIVIEPEAILGASFQLSFAAVAALVAVYEARTAAKVRTTAPDGRRNTCAPPRPAGAAAWLWTRLAAVRHLLVATLCATTATASFMAYNFHDLSPYVLIGNPLTLALIEFFAVPGALIGTALYPLGLDGLVWAYLGLGINCITWVAARIAAAPGSTVHLNAFAPWAIVFLALAVISVVIWRSLLLRLTAVPLLMVGIAGAAAGPHYDVAALPTGDAVAVRGRDGRLAVVGPRQNRFAAEQWLSADGDSLDAAADGPNVPQNGRCDRSGCIATLADGRLLSLVLAPDAFEEDCRRVAIVVSKLTAPASCAAAVVIDAPRLRSGGATALSLRDGRISIETARTVLTDRPWMRRPRETSAWHPPDRTDDAEPE